MFPNFDINAFLIPVFNGVMAIQKGFEINRLIGYQVVIHGHKIVDWLLS